MTELYESVKAYARVFSIPRSKKSAAARHLRPRKIATGIQVPVRTRYCSVRVRNFGLIWHGGRWRQEYYSYILCFWTTGNAIWLRCWVDCVAWVHCYGTLVILLFLVPTIRENMPAKQWYHFTLRDERLACEHACRVEGTQLATMKQQSANM